MLCALYSQLRSNCGQREISTPFNANCMLSGDIVEFMQIFVSIFVSAENFFVFEDGLF